MKNSIEMIANYLQLIETFQAEEDLFETILHPEFVQTQFPNALNPQMQSSDRAEIFRRMKIGKTILTNQKYEIQSSLEKGSHTVVEAIWTGTMAVDAGPLKAGKTLKAYFCMIFDFKDGQIYRQRNYDCFDPIL